MDYINIYGVLYTTICPYGNVPLYSENVQRIREHYIVTRNSL